MYLIYQTYEEYQNNKLAAKQADKIAFTWNRKDK